MTLEEKTKWRNFKRELKRGEDARERYLRTQGWDYKLIGWYWFWVRPFKGNLFTVSSLKEALRVEECIKDLEWSGWKNDQQN